MNKYYIVLIQCLLFILCNNLFSQESFQREIYEPAGLNPIYTLDLPSNFNEEGFIPKVEEYHASCSEYREKLETLKFNQDLIFLVGHWKLLNYKKRIFSETERLEMSEEFQIEVRSNNIIFNNGIPIPIYKGSNNELYIFTYWIGVLKRIVYVNGCIYIYHLVNDFWILDAIQENGEYAYHKIK